MPYGRKLERALHWVFAAVAVVWVLLGLLMVVIRVTGPAASAERSCKPPAIPSAVAVVKLQPGSVAQLARVAWGEARGEPEPFCSMLAVSWVVINRIRTDPKTFGATVEQVVTKPYQFSVFGKLDANRAKMAAAAESDPSYLLAILAAASALTGAAPDPVSGAIYFYNVNMDTPPRWARGMQKVARIGAHQFLKPGAK